MPEKHVEIADAFAPPLIGLVTLSLLGIGLTSACIPPDQRQTVRRDARTVAPVRGLIGRSVQGRPIEYHAFGCGRDVVLIMATIHGDEDAGTPLTRHLIDHLEGQPDLVDGRRIIIITDMNPDGRHHQTRYNARGVDLNRNFPATNFNEQGHHGPRPLSEPESIALHALIDRESPRRIVSIHQPLNYGSECIDYDGPAESLAQAMAEHTDIPVRRIGSRPGSLGSYAGETLGIPIITLELPKDAKGVAGRELWNQYGRMMLAAISYPEKL
ncbi:MAG: DUF2817 domain-containing protein [Phycisphaerae bacterium]|nr:DUF2817 domain-containing protein [Phycisphaerae bacterium]